MDAFVAIYWIGAISCGFLYWFKYSTTHDTYILRRYKTGFAMFFWPIFLLRVIMASQAQNNRQAETDDVKKRILGE
jgi:hypothetical protein